MNTIIIQVQLELSNEPSQQIKEDLVKNIANAIQHRGEDVGMISTNLLPETEEEEEGFPIVEKIHVIHGKFTQTRSFL